MHQFPNEIILKIFDFLDRDSLVNVLSVCKRYRELIISNSIFMRKLPMKLSKNWLDKIEFANNFGDYVRALEMKYTTFESLDEFKTLINLFPNVEELKINYIYIKQPQLDLITRQRETITADNNEPCAFPLLKSVELSSKFFGYITQLDSKILYHLNTSNLEEIKIKLPMQKFSAEFIEFLCKQSKLKHLIVFDEFIDSFLFDDFNESLTYNQFISSLFEIDLSAKAKFQLRKLSINYRGDHRENFQKFLNTQNELEELEIRKYEDDFVRFKLSFDLIKDFRVRKLTIPLELLSIPAHMIDDLDRYVNKNVVELSLMGYNNDPIIFNLLLKIFPNIKHLRLEYMLEFPCESLSNLLFLESLEADHFKIDSLQNVKIKKLKKLTIGTLYPFVYTDFEGITKINSTIEEIVIKEVSHFNTMTAIKNSIGIILRDLKQLKYLKITQNESSDCIKLIADMTNKRLNLSLYGMKMLKEIFTQAHQYHAINYLF